MIVSHPHFSGIVLLSLLLGMFINAYKSGVICDVVKLVIPAVPGTITNITRDHLVLVAIYTHFMLTTDPFGLVGAHSELRRNSLAMWKYCLENIKDGFLDLLLHFAIFLAIPILLCNLLLPLHYYLKLFLTTLVSFSIVCSLPSSCSFLYLGPLQSSRIRARHR